MYEKLLVAVDHSQSTGRVIDAARELALLAGSEVWVLHLRERAVPGKVPMGPGLAGDETTGEAQRGVDAVVGEFTRAGIKAHGELRHTVFGYAAREIVEDAKGHDVDAIVMGSRGRGDLAGLVLGSTAHKVIQLADRPVLVVR
jgi:nucleotide-binding universal stress UspA family protein